MYGPVAGPISYFVLYLSKQIPVEVVERLQELIL